MEKPNKFLFANQLRGIAVLAVLLSHWFGVFWGMPELVGRYTSSEMVQGPTSVAFNIVSSFAYFNFGSFGVSIFFLISGFVIPFSLEKLNARSFLVARFFRIFPLLWIVTFLSILLAWKVPNLKNLFLNLTGLFGFVKWNVYFSTGVWSIGNEIVFYFFFPFFLFLNKYNKYLLIVIGLIIFFLYVYFAFDVLDSNITLSKQWKNYTNPLNQLFLFFGGFIIGKTYINSNINNKINISLILFSLLLFCVYPVDGDRINLVTGFNRIVFTFCSFLVCLSFFKFNYSLPKIFDSPFSFLGEASYSIYLLHPIIYKIVDVFSDDFFQFSNFFLYDTSFVS